MTTLAQPDLDVSQIWPGAFQKGERTTTSGNPCRDYFIADGERYAMDCAHCGLKSDWYQYDTEQDAPYFGTWCNPVTRQVLSYCEGDICLTDCATPGHYRAELAAHDAYCEGTRHGIDNHDRKHWAKLGD